MTSAKQTQEQRLHAMERGLYEKVDKHKDDYTAKHASLESRVGALEAHMQHAQTAIDKYEKYILALFIILITALVRVFGGLSFS